MHYSNIHMLAMHMLIVICICIYIYVYIGCIIGVFTGSMCLEDYQEDYVVVGSMESL